MVHQNERFRDHEPLGRRLREITTHAISQLTPERDATRLRSIFVRRDILSTPSISQNCLLPRTARGNYCDLNRRPSAIHTYSGCASVKTCTSRVNGQVFVLRLRLRSVRTSCLLIILLIPVMLGLNLRPVQGNGVTVNIISVDSPGVVRAGDSFQVIANGDYQSSGPFSVDLLIVELTGLPMHLVAKDTYNVGNNQPVSGKWQLRTRPRSLYTKTQ